MDLRWIAGALLAGLVSTPAAANPTHRHLQQLSEPERSAVLAKLVRNGGETCPAVTRTFFQGSDKTGAAFWNVQCAGGKAWSIMIRNDRTGSARYVDCEVMESLEAGMCFKRFR